MHSPRDAREVPEDSGIDLLTGNSGAPSRRRRSRAGRVFGICALIIAMLLGLAIVGLYLLTENVGNNLGRVPHVFGPLDEAKRPPRTDQSLTFLLIGADSRSPGPTTGSDAAPGVDPGSQRGDLIMLAQFTPGSAQAAVVSIPRDSWVDIPGHGRNKINAALAVGGPTLLIQTVEDLTRLRIDHFAVIDFAGFQKMVDAAGGIDVQVAAATSDGGADFHTGLNHLDGGKALTYVRQRHNLPRGDVDRIQRQQNALRALLTKAASNGAASNPVGLYQLIEATSQTVSIDDTLTNGGLRSLAFQLRDTRPGNMTFVSAPIGGQGYEGTQAVVYLDVDRATELWMSVRDGTLSEYARLHPADALGTTPP